MTLTTTQESISLLLLSVVQNTKAREHFMFCDMNYFEELLEKERLRKLDTQYFSGAENAVGSQYRDDFESISGIVGSGGFGIIKLSKPKKKNQQV